MLKKNLNFRAQKPHYVQELTTEDCDRRMEYGELMLSWHEDWPKLFETFSGATRPFSISAVSSIDIIAITGRHTVPE